jgi:3-oxoacyl-[acyl-carrier protein] reductase
MDFDGRTAVITGASRGIGEATAKHLAERGEHVVIGARSRARLDALASEIEASGRGRATAFTCDTARAGDVAALIETAVTRTGRLDVLVNNAGVIEPLARLSDSDPAAWSGTVDVNLKGVYHGMRFAIPRMLHQGGGTIINISSGAATSALEGWSHYCASKAGVLSLTRCADKEYREHGIRVIGLSPGTVATDMQRRIKASGLNPVSQLDPAAHLPPAWVATAIAYLCSSAADVHRGSDFSLKTEAGRAEAGILPPP